MKQIFFLALFSLWGGVLMAQTAPYFDNGSFDEVEIYSVPISGIPNPASSGHLPDLEAFGIDVYAKNILSLYGEKYLPIVPEIEFRTDNVSRQGASGQRLRMSVSPNPTDSYVVFDWSAFNLNGQAVRIELYDRMGSLLTVITDTRGISQKKISLESFQSGILYYHLHSKTKELDQGQLILNK